MSSSTIADQPNDLKKSIDISLKLLGDFAVVPGASQLMQGELGSGLAHAALGVAGSALLGPLGWAAVAANSFTKSLSDDHIWTHVSHATSSLATKRDETKSGLVVAAIKAAREKDPEKRSDSDNKILEAAGAE